MPYLTPKQVADAINQCLARMQLQQLQEQTQTARGCSVTIKPKEGEDGLRSVEVVVNPDRDFAFNANRHDLIAWNRDRSHQGASFVFDETNGANGWRAVIHGIDQYNFAFFEAIVRPE